MAKTKRPNHELNSTRSVSPPNPPLSQPPIKRPRRKEDPSTHKKSKAKGKGKASNIANMPHSHPSKVVYQLIFEHHDIPGRFFPRFQSQDDVREFGSRLAGLSVDTHHSEFNVLDSLRLYAIGTGLSIDLGYLFFEGIAACLASHHDRSGPYNALVMGSLITKIMAQNDADDRFLQMKAREHTRSKGHIILGSSRRSTPLIDPPSNVQGLFAFMKNILTKEEVGQDREASQHSPFKF
ncbi:hypothetical protein LguiA_029138 [Lonicera macranthoides]